MIVLFSDRPVRIVTSVSTLIYIDNRTTGEDSFAIDPPNAVLVLDEAETQGIVIMELFKPILFLIFSKNKFLQNYVKNRKIPNIVILLYYSNS